MSDPDWRSKNLSLTKARSKTTTRDGSSNKGSRLDSRRDSAATCIESQSEKSTQRRHRIHVHADTCHAPSVGARELLEADGRLVWRHAIFNFVLKYERVRI